jgi:hypothetical protein
VQRTLRPDGYFLFADYRPRSKMARLHIALKGMGFEIVMLEDITPGILRGLEREETRKEELIARRMPRFLRATASRFAASAVAREAKPTSS